MEKKDFFVSYNKNNKDWAKWIAGTLEENGYTVYLQAWDIVPGDDFISRMNDFLKYSRNYIAVLSRSFWASEYCKTEFQTAFNSHLNKDIIRFLPVRIEDVSPDALYNTIVYLDLFNLNEPLATAKLLQAVGHTINPRKKGPFPQNKKNEDIHTSSMSLFPGQIEATRYKDAITQNTKIRDIIALDSNKNQSGDLFNHMIYDVLHSLGFGEPRHNIVKSGREIDMVLQHRTEKRYAIVESKAHKEKVGGADLNKFAGVFDVERGRLEAEGNNVVGYFISQSGFTATAIEQENERASARKRRGEESELVLLGPDEIVRELIHGNVLCSLEKAVDAIREVRDNTLSLCEYVDLIACKQGWIWVLYYSSYPQQAATHFALVHADGNQLLNEIADIVIKQAIAKQIAFSKLTYIKASSHAILDKQAAQKAYFKYLENELGEIQFEGMPTDKEAGAVKVNLESIFVPLRFNYQTKGNNGKPHTTTTTIKGVLTNTPRAAVLAKPGGGKSTLIRRMALAYAYPERRKKVDDGLPDNDWFPIYIRCRDLGEDANKSILDIIETIVHRAEISTYYQLFNALVEDNLQNGKLLLLIDGLDEISVEKTRVRFVNQLRTFIATYPTVHLIITSRKAGFRAVAGTLASYCKQYSIANLEEEEIRSLSLKWHQAILGESEQAKEDSNKVCEIILNDPRIMALAENPLLLTTLLFVKRWVGYLPTKKCRLYEEMIKLLLVTWNAAGHDKLDMDETEPQLAFVAYRMTMLGHQKITRDKLEKYIIEARNALPELLGYTEVSPSKFIDQVEERSSLLIQMGLEENDKGNLVASYEFSHLSFQEYLTAKAIAESWLPTSNSNDNLLGVLKPHINEDHWIEVVPLAAVLSGRHAKSLIEYLLEMSQVDNEQKQDSNENIVLLHLANCVASEVPMSQDLLEKAIVCIAKGKSKIERINLRINSAPYSSSSINVFSTITKSKYGSRYREIIERELFLVPEDEFIYEFADLWIWITLSYYENNADEQLILNMLKSDEHKSNITGALLMMQRTFKSIHELPRNAKHIQNTELTEEIFQYLLKLLHEDNKLSIFSAAWCIAWSGYNEKDIIPHDLVPTIATRLVSLWINTPSSGDLKRTISWALYCICMPGLQINKSEELFGAIERNYEKSGNDYDRAAAIHLGALTNYWTLNNLRQILKSQEFPLNNRIDDSRLLTEMGLFEKGKDRKHLLTV